jgi:hypothetical protein
MSHVYVLGQFSTANALLDATRTLRERGKEDLETYSPYPVHGMEETLGTPKSRVPLLVLGGGLTGCTVGFLMQWWCNAVDYPINVGGRPLISLPSMVPICFELSILLGAFGAFFGLMMLMGLPRLHHPVFDADAFRSASVDHFWISFRTDDVEKAQAELSGLGASEISVVEDRE